MYDYVTQGIYIAVVFCVLIIAVINYYQHHRYTRRARRLGTVIYVALFAAACGVWALGLLSALPMKILRVSFLNISFHVILVLYLVPAGLYWAWRNRVRGMPLVRACARRKRGQPLPTPQRAYPWKWVLLAGVLVNLYTYGIFALFRPGVTENFRLSFLKPEFDTLSFLILVLIISTAAPFYEEVIFRLAFQNLVAIFLRKRGISTSWAIVLSAGVWTLGHTGLVVPVGVKELQIFGVGLVLGKVMEKAGLEGCIAVHLMLNLCAILYAPTVVSL